MLIRMLELGNLKELYIQLYLEMKMKLTHNQFGHILIELKTTHRMIYDYFTNRTISVTFTTKFRNINRSI